LEAHGAMGRHSERWGGIWGHGQGPGAVGRHTGLWAGLEICGEVYLRHHAAIIRR